jgi:catechol 2,3-dioxygenase-like lactoylglutathione lyase family enzyme
MLRKIDRVILRVGNLLAAVAYYRDVMGLTVVRQEARLASLKLPGDGTELVLHTDPDLPHEAVYYLVDDVRELYRRRGELKLRFASPPTQVSRGFRATVKDPFDNVLLLLDRTTEASASANVEDAKSPGNLFAGVEPRRAVRGELLIELYEKVGRTADDLPYTPHFEGLFAQYAGAIGEPRPTKAEVWRHLLTLRKSGKLPKLGPARSRPPAVSAEDRQHLREMLGDDIGKRDRLPYTDRFDTLVDEFNRTQPRNLSPHLVWRLVATLAK